MPARPQREGNYSGHAAGQTNGTGLFFSWKEPCLLSCCMFAVALLKPRLEVYCLHTALNMLPSPLHCVCGAADLALSVLLPMLQLMLIPFVPVLHLCSLFALACRAYLLLLCGVVLLLLRLSAVILQLAQLLLHVPILADSLVLPLGRWSSVNVSHVRRFGSHLFSEGTL
jgi:hypothetical protein